MDKKLQSYLVDKKYHPAKSKEILLEEAGNIIQNEIYAKTDFAGLIFFMGKIWVTIKKESEHPKVIDKERIIIQGNLGGAGGFEIKCPYEAMENRGETYYVKKSMNHNLHVPKHFQHPNKLELILEFKSQNSKKEKKTKIDLLIDQKTKIFYLPFIPEISTKEIP